MNGLFMLTQAADYVEGKNQQQQPPAQPPPPPQLQEKIVTDYPQPPQQPNPGRGIIYSPPEVSVAINDSVISTGLSGDSIMKQVNKQPESFLDALVEASGPEQQQALLHQAMTEDDVTKTSSLSAQETTATATSRFAMLEPAQITTAIPRVPSHQQQWLSKSNQYATTYVTPSVYEAAAKYPSQSQHQQAAYINPLSTSSVEAFQDKHPCIYVGTPVAENAGTESNAPKPAQKQTDYGLNNNSVATTTSTGAVGQNYTPLNTHIYGQPQYSSSGGGNDQTSTASSSTSNNTAHTIALPRHQFTQSQIYSHMIDERAKQAVSQPIVKSAITKQVSLTHNELEKNRRRHLKQCFEELREVIPRLGARKTSNLTILKSAAKHLQFLEKKAQKLEQDKEKILQRMTLRKLYFEKLYSSVIGNGNKAKVDEYLETSPIPENMVYHFNGYEEEDVSTSTASEDEDKVSDRMNSNGNSRIIDAPVNTSNQQQQQTTTGAPTVVTRPAITATTSNDQYQPPTVSGHQQVGYVVPPPTPTPQKQQLSNGHHVMHVLQPPLVAQSAAVSTIPQQHMLIRQQPAASNNVQRPPVIYMVPAQAHPQAPTTEKRPPPPPPLQQQQRSRLVYQQASGRSATPSPPSSERMTWFQSFRSSASPPLESHQQKTIPDTSKPQPAITTPTLVKTVHLKTSDASSETTTMTKSNKSSPSAPVDPSKYNVNGYEVKVNYLPNAAYPSTQAQTVASDSPVPSSSTSSSSAPSTTVSCCTASTTSPTSSGIKVPKTVTITPKTTAPAAPAKPKSTGRSTNYTSLYVAASADNLGQSDGENDFEATLENLKRMPSSSMHWRKRMANSATRLTRMEKASSNNSRHISALSFHNLNQNSTSSTASTITSSSSATTISTGTSSAATSAAPSSVATVTSPAPLLASDAPTAPPACQVPSLAVSAPMVDAVGSGVALSSSNPPTPIVLNPSAVFSSWPPGTSADFTSQRTHSQVLGQPTQATVVGHLISSNNHQHQRTLSAAITNGTNTTFTTLQHRPALQSTVFLPSSAKPAPAATGATEPATPNTTGSVMMVPSNSPSPINKMMTAPTTPLILASMPNQPHQVHQIPTGTTAQLAPQAIIPTTLPNGQVAYQLVHQIPHPHHQQQYVALNSSSPTNGGQQQQLVALRHSIQPHQQAVVVPLSFLMCHQQQPQQHQQHGVVIRTMSGDSSKSNGGGKRSLEDEENDNKNENNNNVKRIKHHQVMQQHHVMLPSNTTNSGATGSVVMALPAHNNFNLVNYPFQTHQPAIIHSGQQQPQQIQAVGLPPGASLAVASNQFMQSQQ